MLEVIDSKSQVRMDQLQAGALILIDKPKGWTSFDVVNKLRYTIKHKVGVKKYKVGHAGTLDPLATGLLLICISKYTKKIHELMGLDKTYLGSMKLWEETPSYDAEWLPSTYHPRRQFTSEELESTRQALSGQYMQKPPVFSAIKKKGIPLYRLARRGDAVTVEARPVDIKSFKISRVDLPFIDFSVSCSKGTYIRSLVHDFGKALNNGAFLSALHRTRIGHYAVDEAWSLEELISAIEQI